MSSTTGSFELRSIIDGQKRRALFEPVAGIVGCSGRDGEREVMRTVEVSLDEAHPALADPHRHARNRPGDDAAKALEERGNSRGGACGKQASLICMSSSHTLNGG